MNEEKNEKPVVQRLQRNIGVRRLARKIQSKMTRFLGLEMFPNLQSSLIELNDVGELKKIFGWRQDPILQDPQIHEFEDICDVNGRRMRDAEVLGTVMRNAHPHTCLEIGTEEGHGTALMAVNAPNARIFTVNIPPEEIRDGKGGILTTGEIEREKIGSYYRSRNLPNIQQIFANTSCWEPDIGMIDVAFIDGCHDAKFAYNDTRILLEHMRPGAFILWHDFHPGLKDAFYWIYDVCLGVERLLREEWLEGKIYHLRDSWTGVYQLR